MESARDVALFPPHRTPLARQRKIAHNCVGLRADCVEVDVLRLDIAMREAVEVDKTDGRYDLSEYPVGLLLREARFVQRSEVLYHVTIGRILENEAHAMLIFFDFLFCSTSQQQQSARVKGLHLAGLGGKCVLPPAC